jgi:hypothetical protein
MGVGRVVVRAMRVAASRKKNKNLAYDENT